MYESIEIFEAFSTHVWLRQRVKLSHINVVTVYGEEIINKYFIVSKNLHEGYKYL